MWLACWLLLTRRKEMFFISQDETMSERRVNLHHYVAVTEKSQIFSRHVHSTSRIRIRFYDKTQFQFFFLGFSHMICFLLKQQRTKRKWKYFYDFSNWMSVMLYEIIFRRTLLGLWNNLKLFLTSTSERAKKRWRDKEKSFSKWKYKKQHLLKLTQKQQHSSLQMTPRCGELNFRIFLSEKWRKMRKFWNVCILYLNCWTESRGMYCSE